MSDFKKTNIAPNILYSILCAGLSAATGGLFNETVAGVLGNMLTDFASHFAISGGSKMYAHLNAKEHSGINEANHHLQEGFKEAMAIALQKIMDLYFEKYNVNEIYKRQIELFTKDLIEDIQNTKPPFDKGFEEGFVDNYIRNYEQAGKELKGLLSKELQTLDRIDADYQLFLSENLQDNIILYFTEIIKDSKKDNTIVWKAYQKMVIDSIREKQDEANGKLDEILAKLNSPETGDTKLSEILELTMTSIQYRLGVIAKDVKEIKGDVKGVKGDTEKILERVEKLKENAGINQTPKSLTGKPSNPALFIGRDEDLAKVYEQLWNEQDNSTLLLVNAKGGIGKTTLAARYYHKYEAEYKHQAWVFAEKGITDALLQINTKLKIPFAEEWTNEERLEILIHRLGELERPCLLVIDNANHYDDLDKHYKDLRKLSNFHILLTTRLTEFEGAEFYEIEPLEEKDAFNLFKKHYKNHQESENDILKGIMKAIGYNTLVIELLAKNLNHFNNKLKKRYSLQNLLKDIQQKGLLALSQSKEVGTDYPILTKGKPEEIIEAMYDLGQLEAEELAMLAVFAVLPAENIAFEVLEELFIPPKDENALMIEQFINMESENEALFKVVLKQANLEYEQYEEIKEQFERQFTINIDEVLLSLAQKGWLDYNEEQGSFRISPVIQEVTKKKHLDLLGDCKPLLDKLKFLFGEEQNFNTSLPYLQMANTVLHNLGFAKVETYMLAIYLSQRERKIGNLDNAIQILQNILVVLEKDYKLQVVLSKQYNAPVLEVTIGMIGEIYSEMGRLADSLKIYQSWSDITKELLTNDPENVNLKNGLTISYQFLGETHSSLGNLDKALNYFEQYNQLEKELYDTYTSNVGFKNGLAISYSKLGETHSSLGNLDKALNYFEQFNQLEKELYETYTSNVGFKNNLAISYSKLGETHSSLGNLDKALNYFEQYNQLEKELYETYTSNVGFKNSLAISYSKLGQTHSSLGNLDKALKYFEQLFQLFEELYDTYTSNVGFKNNLAISYSKLGQTHSSLGNLDKALKYFEQYNQLEKELYDTYTSNVEFKNGLAISYSKLGETHSSLGNLDKALNYFEQDIKLTKELYETYTSNVEFKNGLAISYSKLGETHSSLGNLDKALKYFEQYNQLEKELYDTYTSNVEFKNNLAISYQFLGNTHSSLGNLDKALKYFEQYNQLEKELYDTYTSNVEFKNGLAISYSKLGQTHSSLGNLDKALNYFEQYNQLKKELYDTYPSNVGFKNGLAISYSQLGRLYEKMNNKVKTKENFLLAKEHWEVLANHFPNYVEFQNNLAWVNHRLGELP